MVNRRSVESAARRARPFTTHYSLFTHLATAASLCAALAAGAAAAAEFTFAAFGDTPYSHDEEARFPDLIAELNRQQLAFVVHVGDFKSANARCSDELFLQRRDWFNYFHHPLVFVPGDNEWSDCRRRFAGGYEPLERMRKLRELFFGDGRSLGQVRLALERQPGAYPEHARWQHERLLFVTLNVPGGANNARLMPEEFRARNAAVIEWLADSFHRARDEALPAVVVIMHANPWAAPAGHYFGYRELLSALAREARAFSGSILLVHGDTHRFRVDRPLRDLATREAVANVTRVEVHGHPSMNWVRIRVSEEAGRVVFDVSPGS
jgi:hypothetical protein